MLTRLLAILALVLAGVVSAGCGREARSAERRPPARFLVDVVRVEPELLRDTLATTGTLHARESVTLQAEIAGILREIRFEESKPVEAGAVLVVIDDAELNAQLASAEAELELRTALARRQRELLQAKAISEAEYDESQANLHIAEASKRRVEALLAKTLIRAPFAGVPGLRLVSPGAYLTPGTTITEFRDLGALKLDFSVPERYLPYVKVGTEVRFRVAGHADPFDARIMAIDPGIDSSTRTVLLRAELPNRDGRLLPGAFAEVDVPLREIPDAIVIPPIALVPGLKEQRVFVFADGRAAERVVKTGLRTQKGVQIVEGLKPGEQLITSGVLQLRDGLAVDAQERGRSEEVPLQPAAGDKRT